VLEANDQYFNMFGYQKDELIGKEGIARTATQESQQIIREQIGKGAFGPYQATGKRKDGTEFPMELRVITMEYDGREVRAVAIRDLTKQNKTVITDLIPCQFHRFNSVQLPPV
ncbi:MAG: PAS domain S-box protein, partial [Desulfotignum sp.]|nr:PAS domain S-box protein [Desulfotignum sp.]